MFGWNENNISLLYQRQTFHTDVGLLHISLELWRIATLWKLLEVRLPWVLGRTPLIRSPTSLAMDQIRTVIHIVCGGKSTSWYVALRGQCGTRKRAFLLSVRKPSPREAMDVSEVRLIWCLHCNTYTNTHSHAKKESPTADWATSFRSAKGSSGNKWLLLHTLYLVLSLKKHAYVCARDFRWECYYKFNGLVLTAGGIPFSSNVCDYLCETKVAVRQSAAYWIISVSLIFSMLMIMIIYGRIYVKMNKQEGKKYIWYETAGTSNQKLLWESFSPDNSCSHLKTIIHCQWNMGEYSLQIDLPP